MKKKLSRLLCVLLVLTMVCAMVPAVSAVDTPSVKTAATLESNAADNPYIMYAGTSVAYGCKDPTHKVTAEFKNVVRGTSNATSAYYVSYNSTNRAIIANYATAFTQTNASPEFGYVEVKLTCDTCTTQAKTIYVRVYSTASYVTLKNASGTSLNNQVVNIGTGKTNIYFTINPTTDSAVSTISDS